MWVSGLSLADRVGGRGAARAGRGPRRVGLAIYTYIYTHHADGQTYMHACIHTYLKQCLGCKGPGCVHKFTCGGGGGFLANKGYILLVFYEGFLVGEIPI